MNLKFKVYTYKYLLMSAQQAFLRAKSGNDVEFTESLNINLFCALTLEAFMNHLGSMTFPGWDPLKKKLSPTEKLEVLAAMNGTKINWGERPYQSFKTAIQFRNIMAHAETELVDFSEHHNKHDLPKTKWQSSCKLPIAEAILEDTVRIIRELPPKLGILDDQPEFLLAETIEHLQNHCPESEGNQ